MMRMAALGERERAEEGVREGECRAGDNSAL